MSKRTASRILANNWVITLTATLIGVFVALYLSEWVSTNKLEKQKSIATKNILAEISSNEENLAEAIDKHQALREIIKFLDEFSDEEDNLIAPAERLNELRTKHPGIVQIEDSTLVSNGYYDYDGEINLNLTTPQFNLTTIAWETLKASGISTVYDFNCLMFLERTSKITEEVLHKNAELLEYFTGSKDSGEENENLFKHLDLLIDYEESLLEIYKSSEEELKACK